MWLSNDGARNCHTLLLSGTQLVTGRSSRFLEVQIVQQAGEISSSREEELIRRIRFVYRLHGSAMFSLTLR